MLFDMNDLIKALETGKSHQSCQQKEIQPNILHDIKDPASLGPFITGFEKLTIPVSQSVSQSDISIQG